MSKLACPWSYLVPVFHVACEKGGPGVSQEVEGPQRSWQNSGQVNHRCNGLS